MQSPGDWYEDAAARWLCAQGWQVVQRNFRCKLGEIDIIALDGECLVFVEVRARAATHASAPPPHRWTDENSASCCVPPAYSCNTTCSGKPGPVDLTCLPSTRDNPCLDRRRSGFAALSVPDSPATDIVHG